MANEQQLLEIVLRARDELTPVANNATNALKKLGVEAKGVAPAAHAGAAGLTNLQGVLTNVLGVSSQASTRISLIGGLLKGIPVVATLAAGALATVGVGMLAMAKQAAEAGDQINAMSIKTGLAAEDLSALQLAAELNDSTLEGVGEMFKFLSKNLGDASRGTGEARKALEALGFTTQNMKDGLKEPMKFLEEFAKRLFQIPDATDRMDAALDVLGRGAQSNLIFLKDLAERGMKGVREEAERLGYVITGEMARAGDEFNDNLTRLSFVAKGLAYQIGTPLVDAILSLAKTLGLLESTSAQKSLDAIDAKIHNVTRRLAGSRGFNLTEGWFGPPDTKEKAEALEDALAALLKVRQQLATPAEPAETRTYKRKTKEEEDAEKKAKDDAEAAAKQAVKDAEMRVKALNAVEKSFSDQINAQVGQIVKLKEGDAAFLRYTLTAAKAAAEVDLFTKGVTVTPDIRATWDQLTDRIEALDAALKNAAHDAEKLKEAQAEMSPERLLERADQLRTMQGLSRQVNDTFLTDRQREVLAIRQWGVDVGLELDALALKAPQLVGQIELIRGQLGGAVANKLAETSDLVTTLDSLAAGAFDGIIDSMTGAIEEGKSLNDVLKNLGNSLLLGLSRSVVNAAFKPLEEALHRVFVALAKNSGAGEGSDWLMKALGIGIKAVTGAFGGSAAGVTAAAGSPIDSMTMIAQGGIVAGGFTPLHGFRVPRPAPVKAFAGGGIARQPTFGLIGEGSFNEAVVPLPSGDKIPVEVSPAPGTPTSAPTPATVAEVAVNTAAATAAAMPSPAASRPDAPRVRVEILGDVIPRQPGLRPEDVIKVWINDFEHDGPTRRATQQHGRR
jgi:hypothetical protein